MVKYNRFNHENKIFNHSNWEITKSIIDGSINQRVSPILTLDLTDKCNYNCLYCIDKKLVKQKENKEINWDTLSNLLIDLKLKGCKGIEISGGGEPTLYSHFKDFLLLCSELNFRLALISNGSMLYKYIDEINTSPFDWIRVSLDAACSETHSLVHNVNSDFSLLIESISKISKKHVLGISFLITDYNYDEIYKATVLSKKIGAKYIEFKPLNNNYKSDYSTNEKYKKDIMYQLEKSFALEDKSFKVYSPSTLLNWLEPNNFVNDSFFCFAAYYRSVLTPSGVYVCPNHRGKHTDNKIPKSAYELINLRNQEIESINICNDCSSFCSRKLINKILDSIIKINNKDSEIIDYFKWPCDYGEDVLWI